MRGRVRAGVLGLLVWGGLALGPAPGGLAAEGTEPVAVETVAGRRTGANGFSWSYGFDGELRDDAVVLRVAVQLIPVDGVTRLELDRVAPVWEAGIEGMWGGGFAVETSGGRLYPIVVDVDFRGGRPHHAVLVRPGRGRTDQLHWNLHDGSVLAAHEFGHMIGAHDDYLGGANAPSGPVADPGSVMTSDPGPECVPRARHFDRMLEWFQDRTGTPGRVVAHRKPGGDEVASGGSETSR